MRLSVDVKENSILVLSQAHHPGWTVTVDEKSADVLRANYTLTATYLDPGVHDIRFVFQPWSFRVGATLSILSLMVITIGLFGVPRTYFKKLS